MKVATDIGGTFTDLVAINENGSLILEKAHTTPPNFDQGVMDVLKKSGVDMKSIEAFFHGTTTIINALTERKGAKTALITTKGFRDILELARGNRPDLFNMVFEKPTPFVPRYLRREVTERISYKGEILTPLSEEDIRTAVEYLKRNRWRLLLSATSILMQMKNMNVKQLKNQRIMAGSICMPVC